MNEIKVGSEDDRLHGSTSARLALCAATIKRICIRDNSPPDECVPCLPLERNIFLGRTNGESSARSKRPNCRVLRIY